MPGDGLVNRSYAKADGVRLYCEETGIFLKRIIPDCGLWIAPDTGHAVNLEEPDAFNRELAAFFAAAEARSAA